MKLGICVRFEKDLYFIKERYLVFLKEFEIIFLYPDSTLYQYCDGFVIIGGGDIDPSYYGEKNIASQIVDSRIDEIDFKILDYAYKNLKPVLGICRGIQVINVYFGGNLRQNIKNHDNVFHSIKLKNNYLFLPKNTTVNSYHHQSIKELGQDLIVLYTSSDGEIEAVIHKKELILGVQFHPEMCAKNVFYQQILAVFKMMFLKVLKKD